MPWFLVRVPLQPLHVALWPLSAAVGVQSLQQHRRWGGKAVADGRASGGLLLAEGSVAGLFLAEGSVAGLFLAERPVSAEISLPAEPVSFAAASVEETAQVPSSLAEYRCLTEVWHVAKVL